jgi:hypothetical protein
VLPPSALFTVDSFPFIPFHTSCECHGWGKHYVFLFWLFRSVPFFILWTFLEMQFIPFHTSCNFSPFRSVTVRSVLSCRQCQGWGKLCFLVLTVPLRSVLPFHTSCECHGWGKHYVFLFWLFRSVPFFIRSGSKWRKLTTCMEWNKLHLQECSLSCEHVHRIKNGTERNGQNKKTEFSSTMTLTTGKNGTDRNGTERWKVTTCMEWNKLHLQECSQDKERNGAERNGENLQLVWNGINCIISKNVHRIKNGTERNSQNKKT